jgi:hypothetical protein
MRPPDVAEAVTVVASRAGTASWLSVAIQQRPASRPGGQCDGDKAGRETGRVVIYIQVAALGDTVSVDAGRGFALASPSAVAEAVMV